MDADDFSWTPEFFRRLVAALPRDDWPSPASFYWQTYRRALRDNAVAEAEATEALHRLVVDPPRFLDRHVAELLAAVRTIRAYRAEAERESRARETFAAEQAVDPRDEAARAVWAAMDEPSRDEWRDLVRRRMPSLWMLSAGPFVAEAVAASWAYDPASIPPEPPPETPAAPAPRRKPGEPKPLGEIL